MEDKNGYFYLVHGGNNSTAIQMALKKRGNWYSVHKQKYLDANFIWRPLNYTNRIYQQVDNILRYGSTQQILLNHFQYNSIITTKTGLIRSLKYYYSHQNQSLNKHIFDTLPTSFIVTPQNDMIQFKAFKQRYQQLSKQNYTKQKVPQKHCKHNVWFMKPAADNQGKGIALTNNFKQIQYFLKDKPLNSQWVIQKSIQRPLLYYNRKFDVRVWVLVTPHFQIYYYKVPYMRTSNIQYDVENFQTQIHLTNNAQQKKSQNYSKFQKGNTIPLSDLEKYLNNLPQYGNSSTRIMEDIVSKMKTHILDSLMSAKKYFTRSIRKKQFQLFGYDFLIDQDLRVWLIQVNNNPYLGCPNDFIRNLLPLMIDQMLEIIVDPYYRPAKYTPVFQKNFELLYREINNFRINPIRNYSSDNRKKAQSILQKVQKFNEKQLSPTPLVPNTLRHKRKTQLTSLASTQNVIQKQRQKQICKDLFPQKQLLKQTKPKYLTPQQNLKYLLDNYCYTDIDPFINSVTLILNSPKLKIRQQQAHQNNVKAIKMITHSRISHILLQPKFILVASDILISSEYHQQIKNLIIQGYERSSKYFNNKISIIKKILPAISILLQNLTINSDKRQKIDDQLISSIILLLIKLGGYLQRKIFIPGQSRQNQFARQYFIKSNSLGILLFLQEKYPKLCKKQVQQFLCNVSKRDWEIHQQCKQILVSQNMVQSDPVEAKHIGNLNHTTHHLISRRLSVNLNPSIDQRPRVLSNTERHPMQIRSFRNRRQSAFPSIKK